MGRKFVIDVLTITSDLRPSRCGIHGTQSGNVTGFSRVLRSLVSNGSLIYLPNN